MLSKESRGMHLDTLQYRNPDPEVRHIARMSLSAHMDEAEAEIADLRERLREAYGWHHLPYRDAIPTDQLRVKAIEWLKDNPEGTNNV